MRCSRNSGWPIRTPRQIWNCVGLVVGFRLQMNLTRVHTVFESMIHDIDLAIWYKGSRVKSVRAYERSVSGADAPGVLWACLELRNNVLAILRSNGMVSDEAGVDVADSAELIGEKGSMSLETVNAGPQLWSSSGRHAYELHHHSKVESRVTGALRELLSYVCDSVIKQEDPSRVPFDDSIHGVEVAEAVRESAKTGRECNTLRPGSQDVKHRSRSDERLTGHS